MDSAARLPAPAATSPGRHVPVAAAGLAVATEAFAFMTIGLPGALGAALQAAALALEAVLIVLVVGAAEAEAEDVARALTPVALFPLAFQNLFLGWALRPGFEPARAVLLVESKTFVIAFMAAALALAGRLHPGAGRRYFQAAALLPCWALVSLAWTDAGNLTTVAAYLRNFSVPVLFALVGAGVAGRRAGPAGRAAALDAALALGVGLTLASAVELAMGLQAWRDQVIHVPLLELAKGPISDATIFFGHRVLRLRSAVGEPVNASYIFATLTWVAVYRRRRVLALLLAAQNLLTFGKGGILVSLVTGAWVLATRRARSAAWLAAVALAAAVAAVGLFTVYSQVSAHGAGPTLGQVIDDPLAYYLGHDSSATHAGGLAFGLRSLAHDPLGAGLGSGGNFDNIFSRTDRRSWIESGAESAVGVVMHQLGLVGLAVLALLFGACLRGAFAAHVRGDRLGVIVGGLGIGMLAASLFQENSLGPQAGGLFFFLAGVLLSHPGGIQGESRHGDQVIAP